MKSFKNYIKEASGFPTSGSPEDPNNLGGGLANNPSDIGNPAVLKRINAVIGQIGNMEYLLPEHALNRLRGSLEKIGLCFGDIPAMEGSSGSFDLPLTRFGGRFGKDENTPSDEFIMMMVSHTLSKVDLLLKYNTRCHQEIIHVGFLQR